MDHDSKVSVGSFLNSPTSLNGSPISVSPTSPPAIPPSSESPQVSTADSGSGEEEKSSAFGSSDNLDSWIQASYRERKRRRDHTARQQRALRDPIYFIDCTTRQHSLQFRVLGTSQKSYTIDCFQSRRPPGGAVVWRCGCRDFAIRRRSCKHIQFIWYRVIGVEPQSGTTEPFFDSVEAVRERLVAHHIDRQFHIDSMDDHPMSFSVPETENPPPAGVSQVEDKNNGGTAGDKPSTVAQRPYIGQNCPICYETFTSECKVYFCLEKCGNSVHCECYQSFVRFAQKTQCPYCRQTMLPPGLDLEQKSRKKRRHRY